MTLDLNLKAKLFAFMTPIIRMQNPLKWGLNHNFICIYLKFHINHPIRYTRYTWLQHYFLCLGQESTGWSDMFEYICSIWPVAAARHSISYKNQLNFVCSAFHFIWGWCKMDLYTHTQPVRVHLPFIVRSTIYVYLLQVGKVRYTFNT